MYAFIRQTTAFRMDMRIICTVIQVVAAKSIEGNYKKPRLHYMEHPSLIPTDIDYSNMYPGDHFQPPHKLTDEILSVLHDENTDSQFDKTKKDEPTRANFMKWFEDVMSTKSTSVSTTAPQNYTENALLDIVQYLAMLSENVEELKDIVKSNNGYVVMKVPYPKQRSRREVNTTEIDVKTANDTEAGRRFMPAMDSPIDIKTKLLYYLEDAFNDIDRKMQPLNLLKTTYTDNNDFKIGYIVANIDTLEVNMKRLKEETANNKHLWDDRKVLELFDKLKESDNVLTSLLESLNLYVNTKTLY